MEKALSWSRQCLRGGNRGGAFGVGFEKVDRKADRVAYEERTIGLRNSYCYG